MLDRLINGPLLGIPLLGQTCMIPFRSPLRLRVAGWLPPLFSVTNRHLLWLNISCELKRPLIESPGLRWKTIPKLPSAPTLLDKCLWLIVALVPLFVLFFLVQDRQITWLRPKLGDNIILSKLFRFPVYMAGMLSTGVECPLLVAIICRPLGCLAISTFR